MKKLFVLLAASTLLFGACSQKNTKTDTESKTSIYGARGSDVGQAGALRSVHFDYDKSTLTSEAKDILKANVAWLKAESKVKIQVEGHCDDRGTIEYNIALGERRAISVEKYLNALGISNDRVSTISYGEERPLDAAQTEEAWAKNRRANFVVVEK